jgi:acetyltransferase-like isoleucine patch superfamily enzyme
MFKSIVKLIAKTVKILIRYIEFCINRLVLFLKSFLTYLKLKSHGIQFNKGVSGNSYCINNKGKIILGQNVYLHSFPNGSMHRTALTTYFDNSVIIIGDNCRLNGTIIHCNERVEIGKDCMFGPGTVVVDNDSHRIAVDFTERRKTPESKPIKIGNNVWIGMNCIILKGVDIGDNSIVAAGSVVTKNISENCLFGGNPAGLLKKLD